jgi:hypothetical protein
MALVGPQNVATSFSGALKTKPQVPAVAFESYAYVCMPSRSQGSGCIASSDDLLRNLLNGKKPSVKGLQTMVLSVLKC